MFDRVWLCLIKFQRRQTFDQTSYNILFVWTALSNMFYARMRSGHALSLVSRVLLNIVNIVETSNIYGIDIACF